MRTAEKILNQNMHGGRTLFCEEWFDVQMISSSRLNKRKMSLGCKEVLYFFAAASAIKRKPNLFPMETGSVFSFHTVSWLKTPYRY